MTNIITPEQSGTDALLERVEKAEAKAAKQLADIREQHVGAIEADDLTVLLSHIDAQAAENKRLRVNITASEEYADYQSRCAASYKAATEKYEKTARGCGHCWPLYKDIAALEHGVKP